MCHNTAPDPVEDDAKWGFFFQKHGNRPKSARNSQNDNSFVREEKVRQRQSEGPRKANPMRFARCKSRGYGSKVEIQGKKAPSPCRETNVPNHGTSIFVHFITHTGQKRDGASENGLYPRKRQAKTTKTDCIHILLLLLSGACAYGVPFDLARPRASTDPPGPGADRVCMIRAWRGKNRDWTGL